MMPLNLPGYRYDAATNRYYKIDPKILSDPQSKKNSEGDALGSQSTLNELQATVRPKKAARTFDARWLVERACGNVEVSKADLRIQLANLRASPPSLGWVAGTRNDRVWVNRSPSDHWESFATGVDSVTDGDQQSASRVYQLESLSDSFVVWHPTESLLLYCGGEEGAEYTQLIPVGDTEWLGPTFSIGLPSPSLCAIWKSEVGSHKAYIFTTRKRKGCMVDLDTMERHPIIPKLDSDVLSCAATDEHSITLGLRNGRLKIWDTREGVVRDFFDFDLQAPVTALSQSTTLPNLLFAYAPKGLSADAALLFDSRFLKSPLASFDLRARVGSALPSIAPSDPNIGDLVFAQDGRNGVVRVFEFDTARQVCTVGGRNTSIDCSSLAVLGRCDTSLTLAASTPAGIVKYCS